MKELPTYSVIIATLDRPDFLRRVLSYLETQSHAPDRVLVAAAGDIEQALSVVAEFVSSLPVELLANSMCSSAIQRNAAISHTVGDIVVFMDDDIVFGPSMIADAISNFGSYTGNDLIALSAGIDNTPCHPPSIMLRVYFALQAGYWHRDYGGHLFGLGINCFPVFTSRSDGPKLTQWLPSTCLFVRRAMLQTHQFPPFEEYSFAEDVHLTGRLAKSGKLIFLATPCITHNSQTSSFKRDLARLTEHKLTNMATVAREVLGLSGWRLRWRWNLHRLFMVVVMVKDRPSGWRKVLRGLWNARLR